MEINIPFSGFYDSQWSSILHNAIDQTAEYDAGERQAENGIPEALHVDYNDHADAIADATDYREGEILIAKDYVEALNDMIESELGLNLGLKFKDMESPKEYNFTTDRLFSDISQRAVKDLFRFSKKLDNHTSLETAIKENFTSYDGFSSSYSNDMEKWFETPVTEWDHNELKMLLIVAISQTMKMGGGGDCPESIFYSIAENDYEYADAAVDYQKYESAITELRLELWEDLRKNMDPTDAAILWQNIPIEYRVELPAPDAPAFVFRCDKTPDLFKT
jgi:hypothetical protein